MPDGSNNKPRYACSQCQKSFSRAEHLTRHHALHDGSQVYSCTVCSKSFPRKDALTRHVLTHSQTSNLLERKLRACRACAKSKVRCTGDKPCSRCNHKSIECEFPEPRTDRSTASPNDTNSSPASDTLTVAITDAHHDAQSQNRDPQSPVMMRPPRNSMSSITSAPVAHRGSFTSDSRFRPELWNTQVLSTINWLPVGRHSPTELERVGISAPAVSSPTFTYEPPTNGGLPPIDDGSEIDNEYYLDTAAGRLPRLKRRKTLNRRQSEHRNRDYGYHLSWNPNYVRELNYGQHLADFEYDAMQNAFVTLCINCSPILSPFMSTEFPSQETFDYLIHLYFRHLHASMPFVHRPTFNPDQEGRWILLLAMASASCWFIGDEVAEEFADSLLEFLRRVTIQLDASNAWQKTFTNCRHAQIRLLYLISAQASRHESVQAWTDRCMSELCFIVNSAICQSYPKGQYENAGMPSHAEWLIWSEDEQTRRTAFLVWQIGFIRLTQACDGRPPVNFDSVARIRLPCNDAMFEAQDAETWQELEVRSPRVSFLGALEHLYVDKQFLPKLGNFSHTLLIYGLVQRARDVRDFVQQPLSRFEPAAERVNGKEPRDKPVWAPEIPLYTLWRNAACDCLDVMQFQAGHNVLASGPETIRFLHLHFARVLMLAPLDQLLSLARMINIPFASSAETGRCSPEETEKKRAIQRWASHDQHKARLAGIHAGAMFWYVRRSHCDAHFEPFAVLAASLTLWALSACWSTGPGSSSRNTNVSRQDTHILEIDRVVDDNMIQDFVRNGQNMKPTMMGVEEGLWSSTGPYGVLREGARLLATLGAWSGEIDRAINLLEGLAMARF